MFIEFLRDKLTRRTRGDLFIVRARLKRDKETRSREYATIARYDFASSLHQDRTRTAWRKGNRSIAERSRRPREISGGSSSRVPAKSRIARARDYTARISMAVVACAHENYTLPSPLYRITGRTAPHRVPLRHRRRCPVSVSHRFIPRQQPAKLCSAKTHE